MKHYHPVVIMAFTFMCMLFSCKKEDIGITKTVLPFKGTYTTSNEVLSAAPNLQIRITGIGQSSYLGDGKFVAYSTVNLTTPPPFRISGISTMYASSGDVFYTSFAGTQIPNTNGTLTIVMTHTIRGGTGIYENASGTFVGNSIVNQSSPTNSITLDGSISY